ncbi:MAG TPA: CaiB/BaiF CoA-transferase family protein [Caulobacterales bacterium]|nr:CaiB/BaiF CoA-transferase family protein [Caulobacterales bacterium]
MTDSQASALAGVRVLDLSRVLAGPWATQILGDLGAEVIKVEKPGAGDDTRHWGPPFVKKPDGSDGDAAYYLAANRNKRSVAIDMAKPEGAEIIRRLAQRAHIVVENFKTGGLAKYALDYPSLSKLNPALVYCSITGFGQTGPYAERPGYDYLVQAMGGIMSLTGEPDGEPMKYGVAIADLFTGMYATVGILAALRHAERTGEGQQLDISLLDCQVAMLANLGTHFLTAGAPPPRMGNAHASIAPYQVFATADGYIVLAVGNDDQFRAFCKAANLPLTDDPRFANNGKRVTNRAALTATIDSVMRTRSSAAWLSALETAKVPCGPINTLDQVFADPQVIARNMVEKMVRRDGDAVALMASPLKMNRTPPEPRLAPPLLGQDTESVLAELLGANDADCQRWRAAGAI